MDRDPSAYQLDDQIGFLLRRATQRHTAIFANRMPDRLTPTQFSTLVRLREAGPLSQNRLGRRIALDAATIKGVVDRLAERGLVDVRPDPDDGRRQLIGLTDDGQVLVDRAIAEAWEISRETLAPLPSDQAETLIETLKAVAGGELDTA